MESAAAVDLTEPQLQKLTRTLLQRYVRENNIIVRHQIDSFDDFILHKLEQIISSFNPIEINEQYLPDRSLYKHRVMISIENPTLMRPTITEKDGQQKIMMPNDARLRNMTYSSQLMVEVAVTAKVLNMETNEYQEESRRLTCVSLGKIPIMVHSRYCNLRQNRVPSPYDECRFDYGGYFIINGNEKVVIAQDRIAENKVFVFVNNKATPYSHVAEVRSVSERRFGIPKTTAVKLSMRGNQFGKYIRVNVHHMKHEIPLFILFRALGIQSDEDIVRHIVADVNDTIVGELAGSMDEASNVRTRSDSIAYLTRFIYNGPSTSSTAGGRMPAPAAAMRSGEPEPAADPADPAVTPTPVATMTRPAVNKYDVVMSMLEHELFPHIGTDLYIKAVYLGFMVRKLLRCSLGEWPLDDRDSYVNKRIDTPGILIANLFRQYYAKAVKDMRNLILKDVVNWPWRATNKLINVITKNNVYKLVKPTIIESGLKYGLATGNWGVKSSRQRQGVAQVLNRMTYLSTLSHLRRINTPIEKTGKLVQPRKLHPTQWGVICPSETPEGASVGLVKNLAMTTTITIASNALHVRQLLLDLGARPFQAGCDISSFMSKTFIFINGSIMGVHDDPPTLYHALKRAKRSGRIHVHTGVVWNIFQNLIAICTEGGRCCRPLYILGGDGRSTRITPNLAARLGQESGEAPSWASLVLGRWRTDDEDAAARLDQEENLDWANLEEPDESIIEYMDVEEANCSMIAMTMSSMQPAMRYTHMELDPSLMLGAIAGTIPFSDHNQAPRNTYQSAMGKQAISVYASNFRHRYDTAPLVSTQMSSLLHGNDLPSGINAIVAIATYTGFNQEDSVIMNRSAVERGLFVSTVFKTYREQNNKNHSTGEEEFFCRPDEATSSLKPFNYGKLGPDGFVPEDTFVDAGDVIIGKCMPQKFGNTITNKDTSVVLKSNERGYIDRNCHHDSYFTNVNGDGYSLAKVRIRHERCPTIGDKFSSRHGQKGTMGMNFRMEDMPFTADGLVPDIIVNPHAIPSRMTIGQLMECILGTACVAYGAFGDATPFTGTTVEHIGDLLQKAGHSRMGNHVLYNSRTGEQITTTIFMGPTYYQRLKHMVEDKIHSRSSNGPVVLLTRQPAEGRARDGGLRLGEMEIECQWSHGMLHFLKERFMECSDNYRVFTCRKCGMIAVCNPDKKIFSCRACKNITSFAEVRLPYACKLLLQEIQTMGSGAKFLTD
ncbi:DNA-directed RNA polymerase II subunit RPB2 [Tetrabaena socialis]|uniref:DNA-directed RNA polymerase subunit beta n=1 Tax=Tetrabaena socialis TaxID=47790 RepID=A0A2J8A747_9CHLO|nr:DNA-directed RNA polymerase II subunit RPB2 [Tetrabaena socialis]|eukprot:PNH08349.1 DNA-directed RNA polymerase II subunit RPB2 [Tetrabaena socialis]